MRRHLPEILALVAAAGAVVAGVLAPTAGPRAALAVLGPALALGLLALGWAARRLLLLGHLPQVDTVVRETRREARDHRRAGERAAQQQALDDGRRDGAAERRHQELERRLARLEEEVRTTGERAETGTVRLRSALEEVAGDAVRLARLLDDVAPGAVPIPGLGSWAVTPGTLLALTDEVARRTGPVTVLECGSGTSTLVLALLLRRRGQGGRVVALESDERFAEETRAHLRRHGVDGLASVVSAPLRPVPLAAGGTTPWYDLAGLPADLGPVDLLFVDGPWGGTAEHARYPALPELGHRLAPGALVVLDDTSRRQEKEIVERWVADAAPPLAVERKNWWSTLLRVT